MSVKFSNLFFLLAASSLILVSVDFASGNSEFDMSIGTDGLQCNSCGTECSVMCGSRKFRTCCFNYIKKRSSTNPFLGSVRHLPKGRNLAKRQSEISPSEDKIDTGNRIDLTNESDTLPFLNRFDLPPSQQESMSAYTILAIPDKISPDQRFILPSILSRLKEIASFHKDASNY